MKIMLHIIGILAIMLAILSFEFTVWALAHGQDLAFFASVCALATSVALAQTVDRWFKEEKKKNGP